MQKRQGGSHERTCCQHAPVVFPFQIVLVVAKIWAIKRKKNVREADNGFPVFLRLVSRYV